jgi:hypothetical protein
MTNDTLLLPDVTPSGKRARWSDKAISSSPVGDKKAQRAQRSRRRPRRPRNRSELTAEWRLGKSTTETQRHRAGNSFGSLRLIVSLWLCVSVVTSCRLPGSIQGNPARRQAGFEDWKWIANFQEPSGCTGKPMVDNRLGRPGSVPVQKLRAVDQRPGEIQHRLAFAGGGRCIILGRLQFRLGREP